MPVFPSHVGFAQRRILRRSAITRFFHSLGRALMLLFCLGSAQAFQHPGIPFTTNDLAAVKSNLSKQPWASAYGMMSGDYRASTNYSMQGPVGMVARNLDGTGVNIGTTQFGNDMTAAYYQSLMWCFTGDANYARSSRTILLAWANTMTNLTGYEGSFITGGDAPHYITAPDILRGTWSGWTAADTTNYCAYLTNVFWPMVFIPNTVLSANQGGYEMAGAVAISVFCDDTNRFNQALYSYMNDANAGFRDTLPNGQVGDYTRDQGHSFWQIWEQAWGAEICWKQGVDIFSYLDNRILSTAEYYARYNLPGPNPPFVPFGATYRNQLYPTIQGGPRSSGQDRQLFNIVHAAYVTRMGVAAPWSTLFRYDQNEDADSFMYRKAADVSIATNKPALAFPGTASLTTGLTSANLNGATPAGSTAYNSGTGIWTLTSGYNGGDPWNTSGSDTVRFAYKQVTGDFTMIAQVLSVQNVGSVSAKAGIMIRDSLGTAISRFWTAMIASTNYERAVIGWTNLQYGASMANASSPALKMPCWIKLERMGNRVQAFQSVNGADWSPACVADMPGLPATAYVGLFGTSLVTGSASTATFANVRITGGDGAEAPKIPPAPFAIYAAPDDALVQLRWNEAFNATSYKVKRSLTNGSGYATIATVTNTTFTDTNVLNGTNYFYVVTASNAAGESTNSIGDSATPQLEMVNVAIGGAANANAESSGSGAAQAFDFNPGTKWFNNNMGTTGWLQYDLGPFIRQTVRRYAITSANDATNRDPVAWQFLASNDASAWTTLDTQTSQSFPYRLQTITYPISNTNAYRFYRLNITTNNGDATGLQLSELALLAISGTGTNLATPALVWSGAANGTWDLSTANWLSNSVATVFQNGSAVLFDDTAAGNTTISNTVAVSPIGISINNSAKTYTFTNGAITGAATIQKTGSGTVVFNSANTFSNGVTISGGTVTLGNNSALGTGTITLSGGTLNNNASITITNNINVAAATTTAIQAVGGINWIINGKISGAGTLNQTPNSFTAQIGLGGDNSGFTGTWVENQSGNANVSLRFDIANAGSANAAWIFNDSQSQRTRFNFGTGTISFGSMSGSAGNFGLANISTGTSTATLSVGALNIDTTFAGVMEANGTAAIALTKVGTGTFTMTGANTYTGLTTVSNGELTVSTAFAGKGNFLVTNGATLGVTNLSAASALVSNLVSAAGTKLEFFNVASTVTPLVQASNVTVGGSCVVRITGTNGLVVGSTYPLIKYAENFTGLFTNYQLQMPYGWRATLVNSSKQISLANVGVVATDSPTITVTNLGAQLQFNWPGTHIGWRLQMQTNPASVGLGANWFDAADVSATNQIVLQVAPAAGSVFYRLVYP